MKLTLYPAANPSSNAGDRVSFEIDDGEAVLTQGFGGWETVSRPERVALTRYVGNDPIGQDVPILLDGYADDENVEPILDRLLRQSRAGDRPPTIWRLSGPVFYPEKRWVVAGIQFGETLRTPVEVPGTGRFYESAIVTRQRAVISFLEYVPPDQIRVKKIRRRFRPNGKKSSVLAEGRSIRQIAVAYYGTGRLDVARALGKAQSPPIRDVRRKLGQKRRVRLPILRV